MAIKFLPFYALILRFDTSRVKSIEGWRFLMENCDRNRNFDGELIVFGAMSYDVIRDYIEALTGFGFNEPDDSEETDIVIWSAGVPLTSVPNWLTVIDIEFFAADVPPCKAWKLSESQVYDLLDFHQKIRLPRKGYECDWPPRIGRI